MWKPPERNYDGVEFEALRRVVDAKYAQAHDELSDAYYNYWRYGKSKPWRGYDVQRTPEESKALFDKLHGMLDDLRQAAMMKEHEKQPDPAFEAFLRERLEDGTRREEIAKRVQGYIEQGLVSPELADLAPEVLEWRSRG